ncbi:urease accessory protein UreF [Paenibacillus crassostreae]|uniref:Urease accessory protein UreF n=1 Tax=Paenibacillus crassostreae TaxID=1763538 RepID=A0A167GL03_9BACL|nr:urease accessory UreF family protein [Paenibacillus crassostreae]AOZ92210.1 hypothetical protein LPB68_08195 [Paenibacillus crassostreae]OAB77672.1 hypothetical protein PNBC_01275 [Paenibacillus crassostreae]
MDKGRKLLDYVQMLDSSLSVGGYTHTLTMEAQVAQGSIQNYRDLELFMRDHLQSMLLRTDGWAIKEIYAASEGNDSQKIALIDRVIQNRKNSYENTSEAHKNGRRLLKLARALYPWFDFDELEQTLHDYNTFGCLTTVHAWINQRLEIDCDQAVQCYLFSAVSSCIQSASVVIQISNDEESYLLQSLLDSFRQEWLSVKINSSEVLQYSSMA